MTVSPPPESLHLMLSSFVAIASERSPDTILERGVDLARLHLGARYAAAATLAPDRSLGRFVHRGLTPEEVARLPHPPQGRGLLGAVLEEKIPIRLEVLGDDPRSVGFPPGYVAMGPFLGVPIRHDDELLGALYLTKPPGEAPFSEHDELFMEMLAHQTGVALEAARLLQEKDRVNEQLRNADQLKSDFVAMASHELRTPLTSIRAATSMIRAYWDSASAERKLDLLEIVEGQAQRLSRLVENLLAAANLEAGRIRAAVQPVALSTVAEAAARDFSAEAHILVESELPLVALCDPDHLRQIVTNLLGNALKYGAPPVTIRCVPDGDAAELWVCDAGPGVPPAFVPQLFDRFTQASRGDSRRATGSGLGLSIVRGLAEACDATVRYQPNEPRGACFVVRMPRAA